MSDLEKLRAFAQAVMQSWPTGDVDGGEVQDLAVKHGLLESFEATGPCCEDGCTCAEFDFPATCYRKTPLLTGA